MSSCPEAKLALSQQQKNPVRRLSLWCVWISCCWVSVLSLHSLLVCLWLQHTVCSRQLPFPSCPGLPSASCKVLAPDKWWSRRKKILSPALWVFPSQSLLENFTFYWYFWLETTHKKWARIKKTKGGNSFVSQNFIMWATVSAHRRSIENLIISICIIFIPVVYNVYFTIFLIKPFESCYYSIV